MNSPSASIAICPHQGSEDALLASRILRHDPKAFVELMRQHNRALFRTARSIVRDDADAEDVLQESYVLAYRHLHTFRGDARLSTWLTRIVINQASGRLRAERRHAAVVAPDDARRGESAAPDGAIDAERPESPEDAAARGQLRRLLERKIDQLPATFRTAFVLREGRGADDRRGRRLPVDPAGHRSHPCFSCPGLAAGLDCRRDGRRRGRRVPVRRRPLRPDRGPGDGARRGIASWSSRGVAVRAGNRTPRRFI